MVLESIKRQAKVVLQAGLRASEVQAICSPAAAEYMERIERLREDKQRLYESLVLGGVSPEEYKTQKAAIEAALDNAVHVHEAILSESKKSLPDEDSLQAAAKALKARKLSDALIDLLIGKVLVYPDNRIEVVWKLEGFLNCLAHYDKSEVLKYVG